VILVLPSGVNGVKLVLPRQAGRTRDPLVER